MVAKIRVDIGAAGAFPPLYLSLYVLQAMMLGMKYCSTFFLIKFYHSGRVEVRVSSTLIFWQIGNYIFGEIDFRQLHSAGFWSHESNDLLPLILPALAT